MELDRLERDRTDEEWGLAEQVTQWATQDAVGVLQDALVDAAEDADFSEVVLVGVWRKLMCHNLISKQQ